MKISWFGHAAFLIEASDGTRIIIDPYEAGSYDGAVAYKAIDEAADAVLATHLHPDHAGVDTIPGDPQVITEPRTATVGSVQVTGVPVFHDESQGSDRGSNTIIVLEDGELRLAHLGDLGHELDPETVSRIGRVDVVLVPVGGYFTIDAPTASRVVQSLDPRIVIPMHYKTGSIGFPIAPVDEFLQGQTRVERVAASTIEVTRETLPAERTVKVLEHSR